MASVPSLPPVSSLLPPLTSNAANDIIAAVIANVTKKTIHDLVCQGKTRSEIEDEVRSAALLIIKNHTQHATDSCHSDKSTAATAPDLDSSDAVKPNNENHSHDITNSCHLDMTKDVAAPVLDSSNAVKQNKKSLSEYSSDSNMSDDTSNRGHKILRCIYCVEKVQDTPELRILVFNVHTRRDSRRPITDLREFCFVNYALIFCEENYP